MTASSIYPIWLTGSKKTIKRMVYEDNGKLFIKFYGQLIEVKRSDSGKYYTVKEY